MKRQIKRVLETAISAVAPVAWRFQKSPRLLVVMYHRVLPPEHPDIRTEQPGMFVSPRTLALHLDVLRREGFEFVHLDDWLRAAADKQALPTRACAITFDDGWRDNYDHAYPILKQAKAPATIYLVSDLVGTQYSFWPNSLARILARRGMDVRQIDKAIVRYKQTHTDEQMHKLVAREGGEGGSERDLMNWAEIREMQASGLVRFGSHTRRHTRLSSVTSPEALRDEIIGSRTAIEQELATAPQTFCYPNGDRSEAATDLVRAAYKGAVTTRGGWHSPSDDRFTIRRIGVHEDISHRPSAFIARISGWL